MTPPGGLDASLDLGCRWGKDVAASKITGCLLARGLAQGVVARGPTLCTLVINAGLPPSFPGTAHKWGIISLWLKGVGRSSTCPNSPSCPKNAFSHLLLLRLSPGMPGHRLCQMVGGVSVARHAGEERRVGLLGTYHAWLLRPGTQREERDTPCK